jgi:hypothetical protein
VDDLETASAPAQEAAPAKEEQPQAAPAKEQQTASAGAPSSGKYLQPFQEKTDGSLTLCFCWG